MCIRHSFFSSLIGLVLCVSSLSAAVPSPDTITTLAGGGVGDGTSPTNAKLAMASGPSIAVTTVGGTKIYIADTSQNRIRVYDAGGPSISTVAGTGIAGFSGDGGQASSAILNGPKGIAVDASGNIYFSDTGNHRIRRIDVGTGVITTVVGLGSPLYDGDGNGPGININNPTGLSFNNSGILYFADTNNHVIRSYDPGTTTVTTLYGIPTTPGDAPNGSNAATNALSFPQDIAWDNGFTFLYIADTGNHRIRRINSGNFDNVVGDGSAGFNGDGVLATTQLSTPTAITFDSSGFAYVADSGNNRIRRLNIGGNAVTTYAGDGSAGFSGDGGAATSAQVNGASGVAQTGTTVYIADTNNTRLRAVDNLGNINTLAGGGVGDNTTNAQAVIDNPQGLVVDGSDTYVAETSGSRLRRIGATSTTSVAGDGSLTFSGDGGTASSAQVNQPTDVVRDSSGNTYLADTNNNRIRRIDSGGTITTIVGTGVAGFNGDGSGTAVQVFQPRGLVITSGGDLIFADSGNHRIRRLSGSTVTTIAGTGAGSTSGDGGAASAAAVDTPLGLAIDSSDNIYIATAHRVRRMSIGGTISTIAGTGTPGFSGDTGNATSAQLNTPTALAIDSAGNLFITDSVNHRIRLVTSGGIISTVVGTGTSGFSGDGASPSSATLTSPSGITTTGSGVLYLSDGGNDRVRIANVVLSNSAPVITEGSSVNVNMDQNGSPTAFSLTLNATDPESDTLTWSIFTNASNGTAAVSGSPTGNSQAISYNPTTDYTGTDSFVVRVTDGTSSDTITVNVTIQAVTPPANPTVTFNNSAVLLFEGQSTTLNLALSEAPTANVIINFGVSGALAGSDFVGLSSITVTPGNTTATLNLQTNDDAIPELIKNGAVEITSVSGGILGTPSSVAVELRDNDADVQALQLESLDTTAPHSVAVGQSIRTFAFGGQQPYTFSSSAALFPSVPLNGSYDLNNDGFIDDGQIQYIMPLVTGPGTLTVTDANGDTASLDYTATPMAPIVWPPIPLPISSGGQTVFTPLAAGSSQGVTSIMQTAGSRSIDRFKSGVYDVETSRFTELPLTPSSGSVLPSHGIFAATRDPISIDISGSPTPLPLRVPLQGEWTFVGIPLMPGVSSVEWSDLNILDEAFIAVTGSDRSALVGDSAFIWDGAAYQPASTLVPGKGYWVRNNSTEPAQILSLEVPASVAVTNITNPNPNTDPNTDAFLKTQVKSSKASIYSTSALRADPSVGDVSTGYRHKTDDDTPPEPPGATSQGVVQAASSGGCGFGMMVITPLLLLLGMMQLLRMRER